MTEHLSTGNFLNHFVFAGFAKIKKTNDFEMLHGIVRKKARISYHINVHKNMTSLGRVFEDAAPPFTFPSIFF